MGAGLVSISCGYILGARSPARDDIGGGLSSAGLPSCGGGLVSVLYNVGWVLLPVSGGRLRGSVVTVVDISGGVDILGRFPALISSAGCRWWSFCDLSGSLRGSRWMLCGGSPLRLSRSPSLYIVGSAALPVPLRLLCGSLVLSFLRGVL